MQTYVYEDDGTDPLTDTGSPIWEGDLDALPAGGPILLPGEAVLRVTRHHWVRLLAHPSGPDYQRGMQCIVVAPLEEKEKS